MQICIMWKISTKLYETQEGISSASKEGKLLGDGERLPGCLAQRQQCVYVCVCTCACVCVVCNYYIKICTLDIENRGKPFKQS